MDDVVGQLRSRLGERATSIDEDSKPLSVATTSSLDALRSYSLGQKSYVQGEYAGAASFYEHAAELDPQFGLAWMG
ncbi:tetratricopeptide repeat protein, partial [Paraburkholderia sp. SIMBA_054]|uniref:tetratricopeptide repeat protein n=1 Tax=Paraburkholderia sp. SIMBA_054 TaxID=3085795 RepID=UPI00397C29C3